ncbi:hypothetical protein MBLNU457_6731t1 [Dothideomycetes sp. NU457]
MFSTTGLFKNLACPTGYDCKLIHCIFSHELVDKAKATKQHNKTETENHAFTGAISATQPPAKKRRLDDSEVNHGAQPVPSKADLTQQSDEGAPTSRSDVDVNETAVGGNMSLGSETGTKKPVTLKKEVSPPPRKPVKTTRPQPAAKAESLNPRILPQAPAGHRTRTLYVTHMHDSLKKLNDQLARSKDKDQSRYKLEDSDLIKAILDEEEQIGRTNASIYPNIIKNRISVYKKMKMEEYITWIKSNIPRFMQKAAEPEKAVKSATPPPLDTGMPMHLEHLLLARLITDQGPLAKHGYVISPPTVEQIKQAEGLAKSAGYFEVCDRCKTRFQVFPDRREEDGALTTNGPCVHHWGKPIYPKRQKTDAITGAKEPEYGCCHEPLNAPGCSETESHAFKISEPARMAAVLPFIWTPENDTPSKAPNGQVPAAMTFDCEMGYTTYGLELIRLTAVSWPENEKLVDVLVKPKGTILDLNTRWSGVSAEAFHKAVPYGSVPPPPPGKKAMAGPLPIVKSIEAARALLCSFLTPRTPLIGHALENDLNSVRLCHPTIIDTIVLFPHGKGLPIRHGLKALTKKYLDRDIQMGGALGHDSMEDSVSTGDLVRHVVGKEWAKMKREGWRIQEDQLMPPLPSGLPPPPSAEQPSRVLGGGSANKRQRI